MIVKLLKSKKVGFRLRPCDGRVCDEKHSGWKIERPGRFFDRRKIRTASTGLHVGIRRLGYSQSLRNVLLSEPEFLSPGPKIREKEGVQISFWLAGHLHASTNQKPMPRPRKCLLSANLRLED